MSFFVVEVVKTNVNLSSFKTSISLKKYLQKSALQPLVGAGNSQSQVHTSLQLHLQG